MKTKNDQKKGTKTRPVSPRWCAPRSGFTLIELLVAIGLFSVLVAIATGGFVNALRAQRAASAVMAAQSNLSIVLEQMAREIRTGYLFCHDIGAVTPSLACSAPGSACTIDALTQTWTCPNFLEYYNANGEKVDYSLVSGVIEKSDSAEQGGAPQAITDDNVSIQYLTFTLFGNIEGDHWNPRITISVGVQPKDPTITWNTGNLETTISARAIDCTPGGVPSC